MEKWPSSKRTCELKALVASIFGNSHIQLSITLTFYPDTIPHHVLAAWVSGFHTLSHCLLVSTDEHCLSHAMIIAVRSPSVVSDSLRPWTVAHQAPLSMGLSRQEYWSGLPFLTSGDLPDPGIEPTPFASPALAGRSFTSSATWEAMVIK